MEERCLIAEVSYMLYWSRIRAGIAVSILTGYEVASRVDSASYQMDTGAPSSEVSSWKMTLTNNFPSNAEFQNFMLLFPERLNCGIQAQQQLYLSV